MICDFEVVGVDLSSDMLVQARTLNPSLELTLGDMRTVRLDRKFDAVIIHDAVSYLISEADLRAALSTAKYHLRPGGILIMCPDWFAENFPDKFIHHETHCSGDKELAFIEYIHDPDPSDTSAEVAIFILINERGQLQIEQDRHTVGLFPKSIWTELITEAGFDFEEKPFVEAVFGEDLVMLVGEKNESWDPADLAQSEPD